MEEKSSYTVQEVDDPIEVSMDLKYYYDGRARHMTLTSHGEPMWYPFGKILQQFPWICCIMVTTHNEDIDMTMWPSAEESLVPRRNLPSKEELFLAASALQDAMKEALWDAKHRGATGWLCYPKEVKRAKATEECVTIPSL